MFYQHAVIVDKDGFKVRMELMQLRENEPPKPTYGEIKETEQIIYIGVDIASNMLKPRRVGITESNPNGTDWEETATSEETEAAEAEKAQELGTDGSQTVVPTLADRIEAVEDALLAFVLGGGADV